MCAVIKHRVIYFFEPIKFGVDCPMGSEKVVHGLRACVDKHWNDIDFSVLTVDFKNSAEIIYRGIGNESREPLRFAIFRVPSDLL